VKGVYIEGQSTMVKIKPSRQMMGIRCVIEKKEKGKEKKGISSLFSTRKRDITGLRSGVGPEQNMARVPESQTCSVQRSVGTIEGQ
jgi:hypothetical protein